MPGAAINMNHEEEDDEDAIDVILNHLDEDGIAQKLGTTPGNIDFLTQFLEEDELGLLTAAFDTLNDLDTGPEQGNAFDLLEDIVRDLDTQSHRSPVAKQLRQLLWSPNMKGVVKAHDMIANKAYGVDEVGEAVEDPDDSTFGPAIGYPDLNANSSMTTNVNKMVTIKKHPTQPLGITVQQNDNGELVITRVMAGSHVERQGLLAVGDIIRGINGQEVRSKDELMDIVARTDGDLMFKISPSNDILLSTDVVYVKAHFTYNPQHDSSIPNKNAGLAFKDGDVLMVVNKQDPKYWQAKMSNDPTRAGLIPSREFEEKRKAIVAPEFDYTHKSLLCGLMSKKKKKMMYKAQESSAFESCNLKLYEEVIKDPELVYRTLVLIGPRGIGRRSIKTRLCKASPDTFEAVLPYTSRLPKSGEHSGDSYMFERRADMEVAVYNNQFIEYGEYEGNLYGVKYDSVKSVLRKGKMCVLDINPAAITALKSNPEFRPYIVFLAARSVDDLKNMYEFAMMNNKDVKPKTELDFQQTFRESCQIEETYRDLFDLTIDNINMEATYQQLRAHIDAARRIAPWVPLSWKVDSVPTRVRDPLKSERQL